MQVAKSVLSQKRANISGAIARTHGLSTRPLLAWVTWFCCLTQERLSGGKEYKNYSFSPRPLRLHSTGYSAYIFFDFFPSVTLELILLCFWLSGCLDILFMDGVWKTVARRLRTRESRAFVRHRIAGSLCIRGRMRKKWNGWRMRYYAIAIGVTRSHRHLFQFRQTESGFSWKPDAVKNREIKMLLYTRSGQKKVATLIGKAWTTCSKWLVGSILRLGPSTSFSIVFQRNSLWAWDLYFKDLFGSQAARVCIRFHSSFLFLMSVFYISLLFGWCV